MICSEVALCGQLFEFHQFSIHRFISFISDRQPASHDGCEVSRVSCDDQFSPRGATRPNA